MKEEKSSSFSKGRFYKQGKRGRSLQWDKKEVCWNNTTQCFRWWKTYLCIFTTTSQYEKERHAGTLERVEGSPTGSTRVWKLVYWFNEPSSDNTMINNGIIEIAQSERMQSL